MKNPAKTKTKQPKSKPKLKPQPKPQPNAAARPYIRPSVTEVFVSLQFHIVDRSVAGLFVVNKVEKLKKRKCVGVRVQELKSETVRK